jgi:hypothetical protein
MATSTYKARHWGLIVYPDSAPAGWLQTLEEMHVKALVSPLHDQDANEEDGGPKPHWHVIVSFDGPVTSKYAQDKLAIFNGARCEALNSLVSYARYLCHLDQPDKHRYDIDEVKAFGGIDYWEIINTPVDRVQAIEEMQQWIDDTGCTSFCELNRYARGNRRDWFRFLAGNLGVVNTMEKYIRSATWEHNQQLR